MIVPISEKETIEKSKLNTISSKKVKTKRTKGNSLEYLAANIH